MYESSSLFPTPGSPTIRTWMSPRILRPSGINFGTPLNSWSARASFSTCIPYIDGAMEAVIIRRMSGLDPASRMSRASSSVTSISSNSTCSFSTELTSMKMSKSVDFDPGFPFWTLRRILNLELLRVEVQGRLREELEFRCARGTLAPSLFLVALERLAEVLSILRFLEDRPAPEALKQRVRDARSDFRGFSDQSFDRDVLSEVLRPQIADRHAPVPRQRLDSQVDERHLLAWRHEPSDRFLPGREDVQRVLQQIDRHIGVEAVHLVERHGEAPFLRIAVGDGDDLREVPHRLEELLPLRDQFVLRKLDEHASPPARRRRSTGRAHIVSSH